MTSISAAPARPGAPAARRTRTRRLPASLDARDDRAPLAGVAFARYRDFRDRAAAADAQPGIGIDDADFHTRAGGRRNERIHGPDLRRATADEKSAEAGDFGRLLRRAGDVAGLAADLAARQRAQSP